MGSPCRNPLPASRTSSRPLLEGLPYPDPHVSHRVISTILRHDAKQTSYKIALLRALNDAVLAYPDRRFDGRDVAVRLLWTEPGA